MLRFLIVVASIFSLSACTTFRSSYKIENDLQDSAEITVRVYGSPQTVQFYASESAEMCSGMKKLGKATGALTKEQLTVAPGSLGDRIAKLMPGMVLQPRPETNLVRKIPAGKSFQIQGYYYASQQTAGGTRRSSCGPLTQQFLPQTGRKYLVDFNMEGQQCRMRIFDWTEPSQMTLASKNSKQCFLLDF